MSLTAQVLDAAVLTPVPSGAAMHYRLTVTNAAATLASLISGGIPVITVGGVAISPYAVELAVENTDLVRACIDGQTTSTATLGKRIAQEPASTLFPIPGILAAGKAGPSLIAGVASTFVQCTFYFQG